MFQPGVEFNQQLGGWIEVVCGPMFSGKTEELIRRMRPCSDRRSESGNFQTCI
jgi:thymidine kinase